MKDHRGPRFDRVRRACAKVAGVLLAVAACGQALAADEILFASSFEDGEPCPACPGAWQVRKWPTAVSYPSLCSTTRIYGVVPGDSFQFTTCVPPGDPARGTGDPLIDSVTDSLGTDYFAGNDDCVVAVVPQLTGWSCANTDGDPYMACAPQDEVGIQVMPGATYIDVKICPVGSDVGSSSLHILWQGSSNPNPG